MAIASGSTARFVVACLAVAGLTLGCDETPSLGDGGNEDPNNPKTCQAGVDKSVDMSSAFVLEPGKEAQEYVCPAHDNDYYKVTVPANSLLHLKLRTAATLTKVQLTYIIVKDAGGQPTMVATAPTWNGVGARSYDDYHCLPAGTYYVLVKDEGDDGKDGGNPYIISYTTEADTDQNEPNNDLAGAKALGTPGTIACKGDVDFYSYKVSSPGLLEVKLTTAKASRVDLQYVIYDEKKTQVGEDHVADGSKAAADLSAIHAVTKTGTYYIAVKDFSDDDSDPAVPYTLSVAAKAEPDANDQGGRNDTAETATPLNFGEATKTGYIASKADVDYYRINGMPAMSADNPGVIEVTLTYGSGASSKVDPTVSIIYPDTESPCTKDSCCGVLKRGCSGDFDCLRRTTSCVRKSDVYCSDSECITSPSVNCAAETACAGAVVCLPEKVCGGEAVVKFDDNGEKDGATVKIAAPLLHNGPWYIRVTDLKGDDYEYAKPYTITIRTKMDPDGSKEMNNEYFPYLLPTSVDTDPYHLAQAKKKKVVASGKITGYFTYPNDQDWYIFPHPCPNADCNLKVEWGLTGSCSANIQPVFELRTGGGTNVWFAFPSNPMSQTSGTFGVSECFYAFKGHGDGDYVFTVSDYQNDGWDLDCGYWFQITKTSDGCNAPCKTASNGECTS